MKHSRSSFCYFLHSVPCNIQCCFRRMQTAKLNQTCARIPRQKLFHLVDFFLSESVEEYNFTYIWINESHTAVNTQHSFLNEIVLLLTFKRLRAWIIFIFYCIASMRCLHIHYAVPTIYSRFYSSTISRIICEWARTSKCVLYTHIQHVYAVLSRGVSLFAIINYFLHLAPILLNAIICNW